MKQFIDDVSVLAVEHCIIQKLTSLLSSEAICDLTDEDINRMAGESQEVASERIRVAEKLSLLEEGRIRLTKMNKGMVLSLGRE